MFYIDSLIHLHTYTVVSAATSVPPGSIEHLAYGELEAVDAATSGAAQHMHEGHTGAAVQVDHLEDLLHCEQKLRLRHQVRLGQHDLQCSAVQC